MWIIKKTHDSPDSSLPFIDNSGLSVNANASSDMQNTGADESSSNPLSEPSLSGALKPGDSSSKPSGGGSSSSKKPITTSTAIQTGTSDTTTTTSKPNTALSSVPATSTPTNLYPASSAEYLYRDATSSDDELNFNSTLTDGGVTITGVSKTDENGIYVIPETIDGKKVVAIASHAFSDDAVKDTVRIVIFPRNVISVNVYSFYYCYNITDIYFPSHTYIAGDAFNPEKARYIITLHSPETATNRNFTKLSNFAMYQGMLFEPWIGGAID